MKKSIVACIVFVTMSMLCLFEADAEDYDELLIDSIPRLLKNGVKQFFVPPKNTNNSIRYNLYTRRNPKDACFIEPTPREFDHCAFDPNLETKMLIPGFFETWKTEQSFELIKDAFLKQGPYNVIFVDCTMYNGLPYTKAVKNTIPVGKKVAEFIKFVKEHTGAGYDSFHLIGHSLGAHISGIAGKEIDNLGRITGLDPAGPLYEVDIRENQLYYTDAKFVDVIHSSDEFTGQGFGKFEPIGDMDFYPNGGQEQPACEQAKADSVSKDIITNIESPIYFAICNHRMSLKFFLHSIRDCRYLSTKCEDYERLPTCSSQGNPTARMGFFAKRVEGLPVKSKFYLNTSGSKPFC